LFLETIEGLREETGQKLTVSDINGKQERDARDGYSFGHGLPQSQQSFG
jgi:hypothetical protein